MSTAERSTPRQGPRLPGADATRFVPDDLIIALTVTDPALVRSLKAQREASGLDRRDEVWEGIYVMSPDPNFEHQSLSGKLVYVFSMVCDPFAGADILPGLNVSDRVDGWHKNYRIPDIAVYLPGNPARNCGTHMCGGPNFAVEILSENDLARGKLDFYAAVNTRELLLIDRDPWVLELYRLVDGRLELVGKSTPDDPATLASLVLPLTFRLVGGVGRPEIEVSNPAGQTWRI
jgi:Uma2 family endonuclease